MSTTQGMDIRYQDENVTVYSDDLVTPGGYRLQQGLFKVVFAKGLGLRSKSFKGESAWSNAERYANDGLSSKRLWDFITL